MIAKGKKKSLTKLGDADTNIQAARRQKKKKKSSMITSKDLPLEQTTMTH